MAAADDPAGSRDEDNLTSAESEDACSNAHHRCSEFNPALKMIPITEWLRQAFLKVFRELFSGITQ